MASIRKRFWTTTKGEKRSAWTVDFVDAGGNRERRQFGTKREADAFRVDIESQLRAGSYRPDAAKVSVKDAADLFLEYCEGRMKRRERMTRQTFEAYRGHCRNHVQHSEYGVQSLKLSQLTSRSVGAFRDRMRDAGVSVPMTRKVLRTLGAVLDYAIGQDLIAVNAAKGVSVIGRADEASKKIVAPSKAALKKIIDAAAPDFKTAVVFAAATGLRASEQWALRWKNVDLEKGEIHVVGRVDRYGEYADWTKTPAGMRTVPLGESIVKALREWRLKSRFSKADDLVFPNRRGGYLDHTNVAARRFDPLFELTGVEHFGWHALRHFAVSTWIEAGLSPKTVQAFAGHSSLQVTMDTYGHLFPSNDHKIAMDEISKDLI